MTESGVCVVTHPLSAAGENATRTLLDILAELGPVSLVTADLPADSSIRDDREVVELTSEGAGDTVPVAALRFVLNQLRMCAAIRRRPEDVVLFFGATSYLLPILFARAVGKTVLVEPRGDVPLTLRLNWEQRMPVALARVLSGFVRALERAGFAAAHRVITYTPNMARELGLDPESTDVYPNGARYVNTDEFSVRIPFEDRENVVGFVGRLDEEKNVRTLAKAALRLPDDVTFRFVGDGPLREELEQIAGDDPGVEFTGWVDHDRVPTELNEMRLLLLPSQPTEGLPTTILEAMACGTPVLATPVSGAPDVVRDGETGFHLAIRDETQLSEAIRRALEDDKTDELSRNARRTVEETFCFEAAVARYGRILDAV